MLKTKFNNQTQSPRHQRLKYVFNPLVNLKSRGNNILQNIINIGKKSIVEEVEYIHNSNKELKRKLRKIKVDTIKEIIYSGGSIPQKWSVRPDYRDIVSEILTKDEKIKYYIIGNSRNQEEYNEHKVDNLIEEKKDFTAGQSINSYILQTSNNYSNSDRQKHLDKYIKEEYQEMNLNIRDKNVIKEENTHDNFLITSALVKERHQSNDKLPPILNNKFKQKVIIPKKRVSSFSGLGDQNFLSVNSKISNENINTDVTYTDPNDEIKLNKKSSLPSLHSKDQKLKLSTNYKDPKLNKIFSKKSIKKY